MPADPAAETRPARTRLDQPLPEYGKLYLEQLCAEFSIFRDDSVSAELKTALRGVIERKQRGETLAWHDLYVFDLALSRCLPGERLPQKVRALRARLGDVAGTRQYAQYLGTKPPNPETATEASLRADLEHVLGELYFRYAITPLREKERARMSTRVTVLLGMILVVVGVAVAWSVAGGAFYAPVPLVVMLAGASGGIVSMQQRYYSWTHDNDPMDNVAQLVQGWSAILLSMTGGAIFAVVLYFVFRARFIEGNLVPGFQDGKLVGGVKELLHGALVTQADYAKLVIWSFIAGFAERFVPDTLSRIVSRQSDDAGAKRPKMA